MVQRHASTLMKKEKVRQKTKKKKTDRKLFRDRESLVM